VERALAKTILVVDDKSSVRTLVHIISPPNIFVGQRGQDENAQRKNGKVDYTYTLTAR